MLANTMDYAISHRTSYSYASSVALATHLVQLTPRPIDGPFRRQQVLEARLQSDPAPSRRTDRPDIFENMVSTLTIDTPHERFDVLAECRVSLDFTPWPASADSPAWESICAQLAQPCAPWQPAQFREASPLAPIGDTLASLAASFFTPQRPIIEAALALTHHIYTSFTYDPTATDLTTPVAKVLEHKRGVCQDFAQLQIAALRSLGLAARYVSGYLRTIPPPGEEKLRGADASHAWISLWCGPDIGWVDMDPTNDCLVGLDHVTLAWGRDFSDVSPVRGVVLGGGEHSLTVAVDVMEQNPGMAMSQQQSMGQAG